MPAPYSHASRAPLRVRLLCGLAVAPMLALGGCTTTLSTVPPPNVEPAAMVGIPYALPSLQYELSVARTLSDCEVTDGALKVGFDVTVDAEPEYVAGEQFVADYRELSRWMKTSAFKLTTYPNRTLKAVNVSAEDKSAEIAGGVVKAGFSIARLAAGIPPAAAARLDTTMKLDLTPEASPYTCPAALGQLAALEGPTKDVAKRLKDLNRELEPYVVPALLSTLTEADKAEISRLRKAVAAAINEQTGIEEMTAALKTSLQFRETVLLQPTSGERDHVFMFPSDSVELSARQLVWLDTLFGAKLDKETKAQVVGKIGPIAASLRPRDLAGASSTLCAEAGLDSTCLNRGAPTWTGSTSDGAEKRPTAAPGIAFRQPVNARLRICRDSDAERCANGNVERLLEADALAPQLGRLAILPFRNGFGANNSLQAEFRVDGSLDWASYEAKSSPGLVAVNFLNGTVDQASAYDQARRAKKLADQTAAAEASAAAKDEPAAELDRQIALLTKQKTLFALQAPNDSAREQAELDARIAKLTALKTIQDLEKELGS